jgi:Flp pilus assembly protein TadB
MSGLAWLLVAAAVLLAPRLRSRVPTRARRGAASPDAGLPLALDLTAAGLRSGRSLSVALALAARGVSSPVAEVLTRAAALDRLGAPPGEVWSGLPRDGPLGELARVATRSAASGLKLAAGLERLAAELRADRAAAAAVRAHRAAVWAVAPLAACFLPSFVCLGVIPVVVGVARQVIGGVRGGL